MSSTVSTPCVVEGKCRETMNLQAKWICKDKRNGCKFQVPTERGFLCMQPAVEREIANEKKTKERVEKMNAMWVKD